MATADGSMRITAIRRRGGSSPRVEIEFGDRRLAVAAEVAMHAGLHVGQDIDTATLRGIEAADVAWRCKETALRLLSFRPRSQRELSQRLRMRDMPPAVIDQCIRELTRAGLLDDEAFAAAVARERLRTRPVGKARLSAELRARGVAREISDATVAQAFGEGGTAEVDAARAAAAKFKRRPGEDGVRARRRLYGFLARRGFSAETITEVIDQVLEGD